MDPYLSSESKQNGQYLQRHTPFISKKKHNCKTYVIDKQKFSGFYQISISFYLYIIEIKQRVLSRFITLV